MEPYVLVGLLALPSHIFDSDGLFFVFVVPASRILLHFWHSPKFSGLASLEDVHWCLSLVVVDTWHIISAVGDILVTSFTTFISYAMVFGFSFWRNGGFFHYIFISSGDVSAASLVYSEITSFCGSFHRCLQSQWLDDPFSMETGS